MSPCVETRGSEDVLVYFERGEFERAAEAHVRYVLDVRDAFELCNARLAALRQYYKDMQR